jgi:hypothetical protein
MILLDITSDSGKLAACEEKMSLSAQTFADLNKLVETIQELEKELYGAEYEYYSIVADLLVDVLEQMEKFEKYIAIPQVAIVKEKIEAIQFELRRQVQWSFREIGQLISSEKYEHENPSENTWDVDVSDLTKVYMVVDALGEKFRKDLLERFAQLQLMPYEKMFQFGTKYAGLDCLEQRYNWFRYLLQIVDEKLSNVLPAKWQVEYHLFLEFVRRTKKHLFDVLTQYERETPDLNSSQQVTLLLKVVKNVNNFEVEMLKTFARGGEEKKMEESIKDAFDPFLGGYVQLERQGLEELMDSLFRGEDNASTVPNPPTSPGTQPAPSAAPVLPGEPYDSSRKIFEYIKGSFKRCTGFSTGLTFLSLSKEFRICLENYAMYLKNRCPSPIPQPKPTKIPVYPFNKLIESTLCRVICTGEYCIDTIPALETMMKAKIQPQYESQVDFQPQIEKFMDTISCTMDVLSAGEVHRMDVDFQTMKSIDWARIDNVEDVGQYTKHMLKICSDCVPRIRMSMSTVYFQQVCSRLASTFLDGFLDTIWQLKRINKNGGGQLLLDLNGIKEYLVKMPNARLAEGKDPIAISKPYTIAVNVKVKKIENILKLICTDEHIVEELFPELLPDATKEEKDSILILKGQKNAFDQVGDKMKEGFKDVGQKMKDGLKDVGGIKKVSQGAVGDTFSKVSVGFKSAFGDIMSGNIFQDGSTHSDGSSHGNGTTAPPPKPSLKAGIGAAMAFTKPKPNTTSSQSTASNMMSPADNRARR